MWQREIAWRRFDERGEERCGFACEGDVCGAEGVGAVAINGSGFVFQYRIEMDGGWRVHRAGIVTRLGGDDFTAMLERHEDGTWSVGGLRAPQFDGCDDIDLGFSPSTNVITIKRLGLKVGGSATTRSILVTEPELALGVLEQTYRRLDDARYEYQTGDFTAVLSVDTEGVVTQYPGLFEAMLEPVAG